MEHWGFDISKIIWKQMYFIQTYMLKIINSIKFEKVIIQEKSVQDKLAVLKYENETDFV